MGSSSGREIRSSKGPISSRLTVIGELLGLPELMNDTGESALPATPDAPLGRVVGVEDEMGVDGLAAGVVRTDEDEAAGFSPVR